MLLVWAAAAWAGGLDVIEVAGPWGSPAATNPSAAWWNPAGLAVGGGTQLLVEGAPVIAFMEHDRPTPDYGPAADLDGDGAVDPYDYGGTSRYQGVGVAPFAGVSTDFGLAPLGVGLAVSAPYARSGAATVEDGMDRLQLRRGTIAALYATGAASWQFGDVVAVGLSGSVVDSLWHGLVDAETASTIADYAGGLVHYPDQVLEDPRYAATLTFDHLRDRRLAWGAGAVVSPSATVRLSAAFASGVALVHEGVVDLDSACPPEDDFVGRAAVTALGVCDARATGTGSIGYRLPARAHGSIWWKPGEKSTVELMGGWVGWSAFDAYDIRIYLRPSDLPDAANPEAAAKLLSRQRDWARGAVDTGWVAVDGRWVVAEPVELGARVLFDGRAIPTEFVSSNNYDADLLGLSALALLGPVGPVRFGLQAEQFLVAKRRVTDSAYGVTLGEDRNPVPTYYPSAEGSYRGSITRIGVSAHAVFGGG